MEVKINKEIRNYTENIYFGLSLRQFIFSVCACISAVVFHFVFKPFVNSEILSWLSIIGAIPFVVLGFVKYNGMPAEKFIGVWIKSAILTPKRLLFKPKNMYEKFIDNKNLMRGKEDKNIEYKK